ncbi:MAG: CCA tRNA nucleotidyltransferase [Clostridia bacterium]|nr:CCA tRNA nucleotidyltransferase [Clostridia bacterium]
MDFVLPTAVLSLMDGLELAGYPAYVVGGCVRDRLMGRAPHDFDICTVAAPHQMRASLPGFRLLSTGEAHGTLTAVVAGASYEITTFRIDGEYADHRRPDSVRYVSELGQDLARRDFTINAMAYHPCQGLVDPFGGREDIAQRLVRCVGDPAARFEEDALRVLRALRFAATCDFAVEPATASAALAACHTLAYVARERILTELTKLLRASAPHRGLRDFAPVLAAAAPGLAPLAENKERWAQAVRRVCAAPDSAAERWTALLWDIPDAACDLLRELRSDNATRQRVEALLAAKELSLTPERAVLLRALHRLGPQATRQLVALRQAGAPTLAALEALLNENPCYSVAHLAVKGADLLALGLRGPEVGRTLEALLDAVIEGRVENRREALLHILQGPCAH